MKKYFYSILVSFLVVGSFSSCGKEEEDPAPVVDTFPSGIFIQFGDSTWKEAQFVSIQNGTAGNGQPFMRVNLHDSIQRFLLIQLDQIELNKNYQVSDTAEGSNTARIAFALDYKTADGYYYDVDGLGGTMVIKESNGQKQIEITAKLANQFKTENQLKARVIWTQ